MKELELLKLVSTYYFSKTFCQNSDHGMTWLSVTLVSFQINIHNAISKCGEKNENNL